MRSRRRGEDEHENLDRWLISYADFITLMFTFFAALYALSSVDKAKMEQFSGSLNQTFRVIDKPIAVIDTGESTLAQNIRKVTGDMAGIERKEGA